jgi:hypothetical protein
MAKILSQVLIASLFFKETGLEIQIQNYKSIVYFKFQS